MLNALIARLSPLSVSSPAGSVDRLPALAAELVARQVAVIAATGDVASARALLAATTSIPIVFTIGADPVKFGLVASYNRPGGNVTGISAITSSIASKRVEPLHELAPRSTIALLMNPDNPSAAAEQRDAEDAARLLGHQVLVLNVRNKGDFAAAFETFLRDKAGALFVATDPVLLKSARGDRRVRGAPAHSGHPFRAPVRHWRRIDPMVRVSAACTVRPASIAARS